MERQNDIVMQLCVACLGAGVITTVAVAQGQNPLTALGLTQSGDQKGPVRVQDLLQTLRSAPRVG
jgi:hypothetical protein